MGGRILLILAVCLFINGIVAGKFKEIAEMKGHDGESYFWFTFIFGFVGMLMVIALPDKTNVYVRNYPSANTAPEQKTSPVVAAAPVATEKNPNRENAPVSAEIVDGEKVCPKCGTKQKVSRCVCWSCGQPFDN